MSFEQTDAYGKFTDKFKTKLTTDDCYTPAPGTFLEAERRELSGKELELLRQLG